jgi:5,10-methenyltetrahydrofolate synthetase
VVAELEPECLGLYCAFGSEFNAAAALAADPGFADLPLALPYARRAPKTMEFRRWDGGAPALADECGIGSSDGAVVVPDVLVVPCVGFSDAGHRLGYGGGYYDRWLDAHPGATAIGVAWSFARIDAATFAARPHDVALTLIVTEQGVR